MLQHQRDGLAGLQMDGTQRRRRKVHPLLLHHRFAVDRERGASSAVNGEDVLSAHGWIECPGPASRPRKGWRSEGDNFLSQLRRREMVEIHRRLDTSRDRLTTQIAGAE